MHALFDGPGLRRVSVGEYPLWDAALALLNRDLAVTLPEQGPLQLVAQPSYEAGEPECVYVALASGEWHGGHLYPKAADDPAHALAIVADAAQDTVSECLWQAWPLCVEHKLGLHAREADGQLAWWCAGGTPTVGSPHIRAAVGSLDTC
ncbi:hypothetical protein JHN52_10840 [Streptomyces sp. MBT97]|uniref:hypothetical protein n=1 Tax=Streptomyces sp. MBT97 TaxID=2800411 RepID=UPI00190CDE08|nr:hypothetical protein [Streptomyces sp. MBT97]MBK3633437.1 hypothetical protein [Streptomyces sp. MBT97]